jgi:hypothetical protein
MVSPRANMGKPPLPTFVLQLEEARAEWRRRHPPPRTNTYRFMISGREVRPGEEVQQLDFDRLL